MEQTLYYNGNLLTLETPQTAEAMLVGDGMIRGLGSLEAMRAKAENGVTPVDLKGKTLLPAFLDPHSHLAAFSTSLSLAQLSTCSSIEAIEEALRAFRDNNHLAPGRWIFGVGYDHNLLAGHAHPDRKALDRAAPENPVMIANASGHMGVLNSAALRELNIDADTPDPEGGRIGRDGAGVPTGYLEENAFINLSVPVPQPDMEQLALDFQKAQNVYLSHGIATAQEGLVREDQFALLDRFASQNALRLDLVGYVDLNGSEALYHEHPDYHRYNRRFRLGGYKIFLDGSPQGKTAWLTRPYEGEQSYRGAPIYSDERLFELVESACAQKVQLLAHCNGDAAADQLLTAMERINLRTPVAPLRPVMIHAQTLRPDQLDRMKPLGMIPSFFVAHTYYWGDVHRENLGARANAISPLHSAVLRELPFTLHQDTPVLPPDMLDTVWCAVNRISRAGVSMGEAERITPLEALRAVTLYAAWQYFEENKKGSLRVGKRADFAILDGNPLTVKPTDLRSLAVTETIVGGVSAWKA